MPKINPPVLIKSNFRSLSRCISMVENRIPGYENILEELPSGNGARIIGITGPPGGGKSTLTDALIAGLLMNDARIAVLAVDPTSPFHQGALLGDRIRMNRHYAHPNVFIRSLASRGSLGGLPPEIIGISELVCAAGFDYLLIETVGVGQSEIEIATLADTTIVLLVPESGDEIQTMKAGLMEIADIFVVNKSDHDYANEFVRHLRTLVAQRKRDNWTIPVIKTIAIENGGIAALISAIETHQKYSLKHPAIKYHLLAKKAFELIRSHRMEDIKPDILEREIRATVAKGNFNLYRFSKQFAFRNKN